MEPDTLEAIARLTARERLLIESSRGEAMRDVPDKRAALADTVRALDRVRTPHAVVGGVAVAVKERAAGDPARRPTKALRDRADVAALRGDVADPEEGW